MKRESGFYWVKYIETWIIMEWLGEPYNQWYRIADPRPKSEKYMKEINETRLIPPAN